MTRWTQADLARLEIAAEWVRRSFSDRADKAGPCYSRAYEDRRAELDAVLVERGAELVVEWLRANATDAHRDGRAYPRLAAKLSIEGWPVDLVEPPRLPPLVVEGEGEGEAAVEPVPAPTLLPDEDELRRRDARQVALELERLLERGEVVARRASSHAFASGWLTWGEVDSLVDWREWLAPAAARLGASGPAWSRAVAQPAEAWPVQGRRFVLRAWEAALADAVAGRLPWPGALDLRGLPATHDVLDRAFVEPLARALRQAGRGVVLIVEDNGWALERQLT